jgi:AcrR family transcriptional regulator
MMSGKVAKPIRRDPERTRRKLLQAAAAEFAEHGLSGTRLERIAARAGVNKRLVYHYFVGKEQLYTTVLEQAYQQLREGEQGIPVDAADPEKALAELVCRVFDRAIELPHVAALVADENVHKARHIKSSPAIRALHNRLVEQVQQLLQNGQRKKVFRDDVDPVRLFISILGLSTIYLTNAHTLSAVFGRSLTDAREREQWRAHIVTLVLNGIRP